MKYTTKEVKDVTVVHIEGNVTLGSGDMVIRNLIKEFATGGKTKVVLDLSKIGFIDSAGLGELVASYSSLKSRGGVLRLANLTKKIHDLLSITQLVTVFDCYGSVDEAIKSFEAR